LKLTKHELAQLIKEELQNVLQEQQPKLKPVTPGPQIPIPIDQRVNNLEEKYNIIATMLGLGPIGVSTHAKPAKKIEWPSDFDPDVV
jgi:Mrp family chromosome partitioning ATPase